MEQNAISRTVERHRRAFYHPNIQQLLIGNCSRSSGEWLLPVANDAL